MDTFNGRRLRFAHSNTGRRVARRAWRASCLLALGLAACAGSAAPDGDVPQPGDNAGTTTSELLGHDSCGGVCECSPWYREPAQAGADTVDQTYDIPAQADAEMSAITPDTNLGTATSITIDGGEGATDPEKDGFFRFVVKNFVSITSMTLRLYVSNGSV